MALRDNDFDDMIPSPCHVMFNCPSRLEDKDYCSVDCKKLEAFQKYIDKCLAVGLGGTDFDSEFNVGPAEVNFDDHDSHLFKTDKSTNSWTGGRA